MKDIYVTSYGEKDGKGQGIIKISGNDLNKKIEIFPVEGKANMVIETKEELITSVKGKNKNYLLFLTKKGETIRKIETEYFYSYGQKIGCYLLLASFENGVDSVLNLNDLSVHHVVHGREGYTGRGRSHYIRKINDRIISVDNYFQQLYLYDDITLRSHKVIQFDDINIRLLSFSKVRRELYLNTEITNELIVIDSDDYTIKQRFSYAQKGNYSSGNSVSQDGKYLCEGVRGEDRIYVMTCENQKWKIDRIFRCGKTPRDLIIIDHTLYVSCTDSENIEAYDLNKGIKAAEIPVHRPITFAIQND